MWKCGSTKGGATRLPVASTTRRPRRRARLDGGDLLARDADVGNAAVGQGCITYQQVECHFFVPSFTDNLSIAPPKEQEHRPAVQHQYRCKCA
jgi:hypothetical protein